MRSNDRLRALWRGVAGPAPTRGVNFDALAARISLDTSLALRTRMRWPRSARFARAAVAVGIVAVAVAVLAVNIIPTRPSTTLLEAVSGGEAPERTFEVAMVGPRDGSWLIAAAVGSDR